ncbi:CinA family protein [Arenivirga flava]|uniref:Competence damage-inducible protein A n=1 Tax=Arenivirga flava TaxID=1930060 RepID=A0AA37XAU4_9MICO|nr:nicotinamide-nucleotide amidohydrolase family protein [Arenivirga flava]GMA27077.1 competence damage-inducible protein A [Arenivirga flava]
MSAASTTEELLAELGTRGLTLAVAESLTGGLLTAELIRPAGASAVVLGGAVCYATELKRRLLGVDAELLERHGPVHPEVAGQMADRVRSALAVEGRAADIGLATTGVAGPEPQDGHPAGLAYLGVAIGDRVEAIELRLAGGRDAVRAGVVERAVVELAERLPR